MGHLQEGRGKGEEPPPLIPVKILGSRKGILAYLAKREPSFTASRDLGGGRGCSQLAKKVVRLSALCPLRSLCPCSHHLPVLPLLQSALFLYQTQPRLGKSPTPKAPSTPEKAKRKKPTGCTKICSCR